MNFANGRADCGPVSMLIRLLMRVGMGLLDLTEKYVRREPRLALITGRYILYSVHGIFVCSKDCRISVPVNGYIIVLHDGRTSCCTDSCNGELPEAF